jgi:thioredoxin reductase (NADPH)
MAEDCTETDVAIIGAGPVGLACVFQLGMLGIQAHVIEAIDAIGGQCSALYPEKMMYDIPSQVKISGQDLIKALAEQAAPFRPTYHLNEKVLTCKQEAEEQIKIVTASGKTFVAKAVVVAVGNGAFGPNRPPLKDLEKYEGKSVFYMVKHVDDFRGKNVVIAGGGDSAVDWAIALSGVARKVHLVHRRKEFRCAPENARKIEAMAKRDEMDLVTPYQLDSISGNNGYLNNVSVKDDDGKTITLMADVMLPFFGLSSDLGPIRDWGLNVEKNKIVVDSFTLATNINGIYAIGDVCMYQNKLRLVLAGFAEAALAARSVYSKLHPGKAVSSNHSSSVGIRPL